MSYATLAEFKASVGVTDSTDDTALQSVLDATDQLINNYCDSKVGFGQTASQARYYTADNLTFVLTDPIVSVSAVQTDDDGNGTYETTWASNEYVLAPRNAALDTRPYTEVDTAPNEPKVFTTLYLGVKITGVFGWPSVPSAVKQAALIQAGAVWSSRTAPFGIIGSQDQGTVMRMSRALHPEAQVLLEPYRNRFGVQA